MIGPARIIGIRSSDPGNSTEPYKADSHSLFQGHMKVYVQGVKGTGDVKVSFTTDGLEPASVTLPVR